MKVGDIYRITEKDIEFCKEVDKRLKEAEERREEERLEEEYLINGGMRVIGGTNQGLPKAMKEEFEFQTKRAEYLLNGGMKVTRCGEPIDVVNEDIEKEIKKKERAMAEIKQAMSDIEQLMYSATGRDIRKEYERELEEETSVELKTEEKMEAEEIMETEDIEDGGKAIVIWPGTELHEFLMGRIIDTENYVKDRKNEILEALTELHFVGDAGTEQSRRVLFDYKYILDCMEDTELSLRAIDK